MSVLDQNILYERYFEEISAIPRGSGNEQGMVRYFQKFAAERELEIYTDALNNVVIRKKGTPGYENSPTVILQAHSDMVCVKDPGVQHDFEKDGIRLIREGSIVHADGTTLGVDDGGGVATILALLDDDTVSHPPLEAFFTASEEVGMVGAAGFDYSVLKGRRLIGMDSGGENESSVNCATCEEVDLFLPIRRSPELRDLFTLRVKGLKGGHSGMSIDEERGNAIKIATAILRVYRARGLEVSIASVQGGTLLNVIPSACDVVFSGAHAQLISKLTEDYVNALRGETAAEEPGLQVILENTTSQDELMSAADSERLIQLLTLLPFGRRHRSMKVEGFVTASCNLATIRTEADGCHICLFLRAETDLKLQELHDEIAAAAELVGASLEVTSRTPGWTYQEHSLMRRRAAALMPAILGKPLVPSYEHGGMECGYFAANLPGVDIFIIGPKGREAHSTKEWMDLDSAHRVYAFMKEYLANLKD